MLKELMIREVLKRPFRPISADLFTRISEFVEAEIRANADLSVRKSRIDSMIEDQFREMIIRAYFSTNNTFDSFDFMCLVLRARSYERNASIISRPLDWQTYANRSGRSSVSAYVIGPTYILVRFRNYPVGYIYSYSATGYAGTEYMKACARKGEGLGSCTSSYFRDGDGFKRFDL